MYPQSDGSIVVVDIDASKGFVEQWVHLSFAIFANFDLKKQLKLLAMVFDQDRTRLIFPLRWACFPNRNSQNAQWVHLFFIDFDDF